MKSKIDRPGIYLDMQGLLVLAAVACASACGGTSDAEESREATLELAASTSPDRVLHQLEVRGTPIEFVQLDAESDQPLLMVRYHLGPAQADLVDALTQHYGQLTMLELFSALAPESVPDDLLVRSHDIEAIALGRESLVVRDVSLAPLDADGVLVEKALPADAIAACQDAILVNDEDDVWTRKRTSAATNSGDTFGAFLCAGGFADVATQFPVTNACSAFFLQSLRLGICHSDPDSPAVRFTFGSSFQGSAMDYESIQTVQPGGQDFRQYAATTTPKRANVLVIYPTGTSAYVLTSGVSEIP